MSRPSKPKKTARVRADELLVTRGFASSQSMAAALILAGRVLVTDDKGRERKLLKAGEHLPTTSLRFRLKGEARPFVSRAGTKLAGALDHFGIKVAQRVCLDLGLSTGGFSDCLLQRGAARVHGVDVAYGVVDWRLRTDPRLVLHERTNVRHLTLDHIEELVSLVTIDLSFIGLSAVWSVIPPLLEPKADVIALIKPQFELARDEVINGVVTQPEAQKRAVRRAGQAAEQSGFITVNSCPSLLRGRSGNQEWLLYLRWRS